jgi:hypothetical protein
VQEVVFETLTKEYEMAKVQEVKEIPTVRLLDAPDIPEKKSFPPRVLIVFLGVSFAVVAVAMWVAGNDAWTKTDVGDPRKVFALEVFSAVAAHLPGFPQNGVKDSEIIDGVGRRAAARVPDEGEKTR